MPNRNKNPVRPIDDEPLPAQTTTVAREFAELVRLRFEHAKIELSEFLDKWINNLLRNAIALTVVGLGAIFLIIAAALGIGTALGHAGWGMLIVGGVLVLGGGVFAFTRPHFVEAGDKLATVDDTMLEPAPPRGRPATEATP